MRVNNFSNGDENFHVILRSKFENVGFADLKNMCVVYVWTKLVKKFIFYFFDDSVW